MKDKMTNEEILKHLKERHGVTVEYGSDIDSLMNYVRNIGYSEGYSDCKRMQVDKCDN